VARLERIHSQIILYARRFGNSQPHFLLLAIFNLKQREFSDPHERTAQRDEGARFPEVALRDLPTIYQGVLHLQQNGRDCLF
jgi:hypothetical protein